jgi:ABC-type branched-subunit amino acid transport system ATPase component
MRTVIKLLILFLDAPNGADKNTLYNVITSIIQTADKIDQRFTNRLTRIVWRNLTIEYDFDPDV